MSFLSKLFGKKKKVEPVKEAPVAKEVPEVEEAPVAKEVPEVEEAPEVNEKPVVEEAPVAEEAPVVAAEPEVDVVVYEIRTHKVEGWQVIKKGTSRARRRFETQAECINYCKDMGYQFEIIKKD